MIVRRFLTHGGGASAVEFGLGAPVFFAALLGALELGVLFWTNLGLQHAAERAARCASVNKAVCGSDTAIKTYAASQVFGLTVPLSSFAVAQPACGFQVNASHEFRFIIGNFGAPAVPLQASACFPK